MSDFESREMVHDVATYADAFTEGRPVAVDALCGRLIRGRQPEDFATMTDDPDRLLVMVMGSDGLAMLPGRSGYEMLLACGYTPDHIAHKVEEGNAFKLLVFSESDGAYLATWDNVVDVATYVYPEARPALEHHREDLQRIPFADIEAAAGYTFHPVDRAGPRDSRYMTYERFLQSAQSIVDTRAFFYFTLHLREQFSGDGYTYDQAGSRGLLEYLTLNRPIHKLGEHALLDVVVELPDRR